MFVLVFAGVTDVEKVPQKLVKHESKMSML